MDLLAIIIILISHYISDYILQPRIMATKKSKNIYWLISHIIVYTCFLFLFIYVGLFILTPISPFPFLLFVLFNGLLHFITDFITSKLSAKFYKNKKEKMFYNILGLDQLIHILTLFITFNYFI